MRYKIPMAIWMDVRDSINDYSAEELLQYYRSAKSLAHSLELQGSQKISPDLCKKLYQRVDSVIMSMRCSSDHRISIMSKVLEYEYCGEPMDTTTKIEKLGLSKSTYYNYYREAKKIFTTLVEALIF